MNIDINEILTTAGESVILYAPQVVGALIVLGIGWYAIGITTRRMRVLFESTDFDEALESFLVSLTSIGLKVILIVIVVSMLGVQTSSLVALVGAAGLAVGLALQGSLANFAGGVLILLFKPFKVGHFIEAQGELGTVKEIQIFNTILRTIDNKKVVIPNGNLSNEVVVNYSDASKRRIDLIIGIGYGDDINKAKEVLEQALSSVELILHDEGYTVGVSELADNSVNFDVRFWTDTDNYLQCKHAGIEAIKYALDAASISIPYPQRDVHIINQSTN